MTNGTSRSLAVPPCGTLVRLRTGKGGKQRCYNSKLARLLSQRNKGGWVKVSVIINDDNENGQRGATTRSTRGEEIIKWRSQGWDPLGGIELLDDGLLVHVLSFLGAGDEPYDPTQHLPPSDDSSQMLRYRDIRPESLHSKFSVQQAMELHDRLSHVCKRFNMICRERLHQVLGRIDVFLEPRYVPWMTQHRLSLRSIRFGYGVVQDHVIMIKVLQECDVSQLITVISLPLDPLYGIYTPPSPTSNWKRVSILAQNGVGSHLNPIDLTSVESIDWLQGLPDTFRELAEESGFGGRALQACNYESKGEIYDAVCGLCPKLKNMKIAPPDTEQTLGSQWLQKGTIRNLHIVYVNSLLPSITRSFPNLQSLWLSGPQVFGVLPLFHIESTSLEYIDTRDLAKLTWISRCECPALRRLVCRGNVYGNGVRPRLDDHERVRQEIAVDMNARGDFWAGSTRFDGSTYVSFNRFSIVAECEGAILVPDSCRISLS